MAAPQKDSLDYFPLDCNFFEDKTIKGLRARFGNNGIAVYLYLLCIIYRDNGYYTELDEDLILDVTDTIHISEEDAGDIMKHLTSRNLFDEEMAEKKKILTSRSIQRRYQRGKTRTGNRRKVEVVSDYWLLTEQETEKWIEVINRSSSGDKRRTEIINSQVNMNIQSEQKPVKDSIVKDSTVKKNKDKKKESEKVKNNYADDVTLTQAEYDKLMSEFPKKFVDKCIEILNNYKLSKGAKYKSDYHAMRSWVIGEVQKRYPQLASQPKEQDPEDLFKNPWSDVNG